MTDAPAAIRAIATDARAATRAIVRENLRVTDPRTVFREAQDPAQKAAGANGEDLAADRAAIAALTVHPVTTETQEARAASEIRARTEAVSAAM